MVWTDMVQLPIAGILPAMPRLIVAPEIDAEAEQPSTRPDIDKPGTLTEPPIDITAGEAFGLESVNVIVEFTPAFTLPGAKATVIAGTPAAIAVPVNGISYSVFAPVKLLLATKTFNDNVPRSLPAVARLYCTVIWQFPVGEIALEPQVSPVTVKFAVPVIVGIAGVTVPAPLLENAIVRDNGVPAVMLYAANPVAGRKSNGVTYAGENSEVSLVDCLVASSDMLAALGVGTI